MTLEQAGITITASMTQPTRPGKTPRQVWEVSGNTFGYESELYDLGARKWRGKFSFWEDPTPALEALVNEGLKSFAERQDAAAERAGARAERLTERAEKQDAVSEAARATANGIMEAIPMGQPILVGHHSERRHRRDLARLDRAIDTSVESRHYAEHLRERAAANQAKAAEEHLTPTYLQNRIDEAQARIRKIGRILDGTDCDSWGGCPSPEYRARLEAELGEQQERAAYWQVKMDEAGGVQFNKDTVKKGDRVKTPWGWAKVTRANAKTCSVEFEAENMRGMGGPVKWTQIMGRE